MSLTHFDPLANLRAFEDAFTRILSEPNNNRPWAPAVDIYETEGREVVINAHDMKRVAALFMPAVAFVAFIPLVGMYVVSAIYLFGTLRLQNRVSVVRSLLIAAIAVVALYVVFERLFQVALPHGLLGEWLDL